MMCVCVWGKWDKHEKYPSELYKDGKIKDYVEPD